MRKIKFRVWCENRNEWEREAWCINPEGIVLCFFQGNMIPVRNETYIIEQYTGSKDKNGVDIYEGDIVEFDAKEWGDNTTNKHLVSYDESEASFCFGGGSNNENEFRTVIGNIHENPELLK